MYLLYGCLGFAKAFNPWSDADAFGMSGSDMMIEWNMDLLTSSHASCVVCSSCQWPLECCQYYHSVALWTMNNISGPLLHIDRFFPALNVESRLPQLTACLIEARTQQSFPFLTFASRHQRSQIGYLYIRDRVHDNFVTIFLARCASRYLLTEAQGFT